MSDVPAYVQSLLLNNSLFSQLNDDQLETLLKYMQHHYLEGGKVVFKEGAHGNYVCFVLEGKLEVTKGGGAGIEPVQIASLGAGESVGEMSIIDGLTRSATVRAVEDTQLMILKRDDFNRLFNEEPAIAAKILRSVARMLSLNLRRTSGELTNLLMA